MSRLVLAVMMSAVFAASCKGGSSPSPTSTPAPVANVQQKALAAYARLQSGVVHVAGRASQGTTSVDFTIDYASTADRFAYKAQSLFQDRPSQVDVVGVPPQAWSREGGAWTPLPGAMALDTFRARRIWSLVPFSSASPAGLEIVGGVSAAHYHYEGDVQLLLPELAGSLIASDDAEFTGNLTHVEIDYWVDEQAGWPVKVVYHASGDGDLELTAELAQANWPATAIFPAQ
jgi:hypothetical protein